MTDTILPFELANVDAISAIDPNSLIVGRSFYYSDANASVKQSAINSELLLYDGDDVGGQIELVISTPIGTEEYEPTFGCDATLSIFDNMNQTNINILELTILQSLKKWLSSRLNFLSVTTFKIPDKGDLIASVTYIVRLTGQQYTFVSNLTNLAKG